MSPPRLGWTGLLEQEGSDFLAWARDKRVLPLKFGVLAHQG